MKTNYVIVNGFTWSGQKLFIVSNYQPLNKIVTMGFSKYPTINLYDIGVWKIKQLKNK